MKQSSRFLVILGEANSLCQNHGAECESLLCVPKGPRVMSEKTSLHDLALNCPLLLIICLSSACQLGWVTSCSFLSFPWAGMMAHGNLGLGLISRHNNVESFSFVLQGRLQ